MQVEVSCSVHLHLPGVEPVEECHCVGTCACEFFHESVHISSQDQGLNLSTYSEPGKAIYQEIIPERGFSSGRYSLCEHSFRLRCTYQALLYLSHFKSQLNNGLICQHQLLVLIRRLGSIGGDIGSC